ncbi:MAG TPA: hypothetical protein PLH57_09220, partial [Oligoflexia bacterium]|nr:hypothetical protein [Oligoflexia bacterium]
MNLQRNLDRCLVNILKDRCATLATLSTQNARLVSLARAHRAAMLATANPATAGIAQGTARALEAAAKGLVILQDIELWRARSAAVHLMTCGATLLDYAPLRIRRKKFDTTTVPSFPKPLEWLNAKSAA